MKITRPLVNINFLHGKLIMENCKQDYGVNPIAVRKTSHYNLEYIPEFVEHWDELIDWEARKQSEGHFFIDILKAHGARRVLDVATGTGFHSVNLMQAGFEVVSVDGSTAMLAKADDNAHHYGVDLQTVHTDWRWLNRDLHEKFDAVICLGNSFTHLFTEPDRYKVLIEFSAALRHNGILILDQRNYDVILDGHYSSRHAYYYCGETVNVGPEYVDEGLARFRYEFSDQSVFHLNMYPLRKTYVRKLLKEVGFNKIKTYGDFKEVFLQEAPDFFIHVAEKSH